MLLTSLYGYIFCVQLQNAGCHDIILIETFITSLGLCEIIDL